MKATTKKWAFIVLGVGIIASAYFGPRILPINQVNSSTHQERTSVPAPVQGQKKVVLKNLGMT
ncbi:MAG: hypothetical protein HYV00_01860 [Deltaproteobacteria bacterium]|nr:hypothetical protein [Deltaproteobacteria bacterium]